MTPPASLLIVMLASPITPAPEIVFVLFSSFAPAPALTIFDPTLFNCTEPGPPNNCSVAFAVIDSVPPPDAEPMAMAALGLTALLLVQCPSAIKVDWAATRIWPELLTVDDRTSAVSPVVVDSVALAASVTRD